MTWDSEKHPRDERGRFTSGLSALASRAAKGSLSPRGKGSLAKWSQKQLRRETPEKPISGAPLSKILPAKQATRTKTEKIEQTHPSGKSVVAAFRVTEHPESDRMTHTVNVIVSIHGDGKLPKIPLMVDDISGHGAYTHNSGQARFIQLKAGAGHMELTAAHEIGHFLDHQGISKKRGEFASHGDQRLKPLMKALNESPSMQRLKELSKSGKAVGTDGKQYKVSTRQIQYQLRPHEVFARAYAQYVATKSGDPRMRAQLKSIQDEIKGQKVQRPRQWSDHEFVPIVKEFDRAFKKLGWVK